MFINHNDPSRSMNRLSSAKGFLVTFVLVYHSVRQVTTSLVEYLY